LAADPAQLQAAIADYRRSVELYPNNCLRRAKLAIALRDAGEEQQSADQTAEALRLDELTPHLDQKLSAELRAELLRSNG
jgi:hypothetical protein